MSDEGGGKVRCDESGGKVSDEGHREKYRIPSLDFVQRSQVDND